jgi:hypothetical protein
MKPIYRVQYNSTGYFTYWSRSTGKKRGVWDTHMPTTNDLSQLPKDFCSVIKACLKSNMKKYGRQIPGLICALYDAGKLCGWKPEILKDSQMVLWRIRRNGGHKLSSVIAFQVLNWRWRQVTPKLFHELMESTALLRFVIDSNGIYIWSQRKRDLD